MVIICPTSQKSRRHKSVAYGVMRGVNLDQSEVTFANLMNKRSDFENSKSDTEIVISTSILTLLLYL